MNEAACVAGAPRMPMSGRAMVDGRTDAVVELMQKDALMSFLYPFVRQATEEFPAALRRSVRNFRSDDGPIGVLGGSLAGPSRCGS